MPSMLGENHRTIRGSEGMPGDVLIVRTSSMGDLVHTLPAITELKLHRPEMRISWMTEEGFADIPTLHAGVSDVIPIAWRRWRKQLTSRKTWSELCQLRERLRSTAWTVVLDCQGLFKSAAFASLAGAPIVGYDYKSVREVAARLLYKETHSVSWELSAVQRNRQLFAQAFGYRAIGAPDFGLAKGEPPAWLAGKRYALLLHATSKVSKEWPEAMWITLGTRLHAEQSLSVVLPWGSSMERARSERLASLIPGAVVAPRLRVADAAHLIGSSSAVIGVDTGLTHIANALNVPLVAIYTDTNPVKTGVVETLCAVNLGDIGKCPTVEEVWKALESVQRIGSHCGGANDT
ncbi:MULTISPECIES: lipopolysaccharide heptosyltransferase I [Cupriavidus]